MSSASAAEFLEREQIAHPDLAARYQTLKDLHTRKLYHELTGELEAFVKDPATHKHADSLTKLYTSFIKTFQDKLNQVRLVALAAAIVLHALPNDPAAAQLFLDDHVASTASVKANHEATLLCLMHRTQLQLQQGAAFYADVKRVLDNQRPVVEALVGAAPVVHAAFYRVACGYYSAVGPAHKYYASALLLLAFTQYDELSDTQQKELAANVCIAALTGDNVFNFGEVLATPLLQALDQTPKQWLADLIRAFNRGDIDAFNAIVQANADEFNAQPALAAKREYIKEKVALLALMVLVFERPAHARTIGFDAIAHATRLPLPQVEWLVMRALARGLIRGAIDQVNEQVRVTYVQPRVLETAQLAELVSRLDQWESKVQSTLLFVEEQTPELFQ